VVVVPGGPGQDNQMHDGPVHEWLRAADQATAWTASVCTGSLILAAAGLLAGRCATSYWLALDELARYGAAPVAERVLSVVVSGSVVDPVHNRPPDPPRSPDQPRKIANAFEE
jgi:putative intracellular protease/amidase